MTEFVQATEQPTIVSMRLTHRVPDFTKSESLHSEQIPGTPAHLMAMARAQMPVVLISYPHEMLRYAAQPETIAIQMGPGDPRSVYGTHEALAQFAKIVQEECLTGVSLSEEVKN